MHRSWVVDLGQPTFSYDGEVWFLVLVEEVATTWWPSLLGTAHAHGLHNQPGDCWSVAVEGGEPLASQCGDRAAGQRHEAPCEKQTK